MPENIRGIEIAVADPIVVFPALSPTVSLASDAAAVPEGGTAALGLVLSTPASAPVSFTYSVGVDDDPATADADDLDHDHAATGSVQVAAGDSTASIEIKINDDNDIEPTREVFAVTLNAPARRPATLSPTGVRPW